MQNESSRKATKIAIDAGSLCRGRIRNLRIVAIPKEGFITIKPYVFVFSATSMPQRQFGFYCISKKFQEIEIKPEEDESSFSERRNNWLLQWAEFQLGRRHNASKIKKRQLKRRATTGTLFLDYNESNKLGPRHSFSLEDHHHFYDDQEEEKKLVASNSYDTDYYSDADTEVISLDGDISEDDIMRRATGHSPQRDEEVSGYTSDATEKSVRQIDVLDEIDEDELRAAVRPSNIAISLYRSNSVAGPHLEPLENTPTGQSNNHISIDGDFFCCTCAPPSAVGTCYGSRADETNDEAPPESFCAIF